MKSIWAFPLSPEPLGAFLYLLTGLYLLFHPALAFPTSYAAALGGGLVLLPFTTLPEGSWEVPGRPWWIFLAFTLASSFWSLTPGLTLQSAGFLFLGTFLYLANRTYSDRIRTALETVFLLAAGLAAGLALQQRFFGFEGLARMLPSLSGEENDIVSAAVHNRRAFGPLVTPGAMAALMLLFIPPSLLRAFTQRGGRRVFHGLLSLWLALGLWSTGSVGAVACLSLALVLVFLYRKNLWAASGVLALGCLAAFSLVLARGLGSWHLAAFSMRLDLWRCALGIFRAHPWVGAGLGSFAEAYQRGGFNLSRGSRFAHDIPLQLLAETGLAGFLLFLWSVFSFARRFKKPSRWEAWGVGTGLLAFSLFSLLDLPFQMPELVWIFAGLLGRLELKPGLKAPLPALPFRTLGFGVLLVLGLSGFWPPFRPWNSALTACALWGAAAYIQFHSRKIPLWLFAGGLYLSLRAFVSPSALGAVRFLESAGWVLCFWLLLARLVPREKWFGRFCLWGLAWGGLAWVRSLRGLPFEDWTGFPNPKHLAVFLVPMILLFLPSRISEWRKAGISLMGLATLLRLRATGALAGLGLGLVLAVKGRRWKLLAVPALLGSVLWVHASQKSSTEWDRLLIWKASLKVWARHPWLGNGPGVFAGAFHQVKDPRAGGVSRYLMDAGFSHNEGLEFLTAFGLVGVLFAVPFLIRAFRGPGREREKAALAGLGLSSLLDFCLHTPLVALQAAGLAGSAGKPSGENRSWAAGFLCLGICLGLFGAAVFSPLLRDRAAVLKRENRLPEALRCLERACRLNAWDARNARAEGEYLDRLYAATGDPAWKERSQDAWGRALGLEKADGFLRMDRAEDLLGGLSPKSGPADFRRVGEALLVAQLAMPFNAFIYDDEGMFLARMGKWEGARGAFQKAVELEPRDAVAWARLGMIEKKAGRGSESRADFQKALEVYSTWKDAPGLAPAERRLTSLPPDLLDQVRKGMAP
jgi:O-antigen ligase